MQETERILFEQAKRLLPYSFASELRCDIQTYLGTTVSWIKIKEIDATEG